ncbi:hypothetical protein [Pseudomonas sp.]|uniref:hypothetical protein n=1 Tax=Pseudomonas sp. TaxID=306 RepID=UPI003A982C02
MALNRLCQRILVATLSIACLLIIALALATRLFSKSLMLLMDRINFIPKESSIFSFSPYKINQGSSSYWLYGEDGENYYYFTYEPAAPYKHISKANNCPSFDQRDISTWCSATNGAAK